MARQLTFDIPPLPAAGRADFIPAPSNMAALALLEAPEAWPDGRLMICGPEGAGKSHLAAIFMEQHPAFCLAAARLRAEDVPALAAGPALVLEDADAGAPTPEWEAALFHLLNLMRAEGGRVLITARRPPAQWGLGLPDLASRLGAITLARLDPPEDALLAQVMVKHFADRQIQVPANVIAYLLARIDRSLAGARDVVAALDALALERRAPVTRALAQEVLDKAGASDKTG